MRGQCAHFWFGNGLCVTIWISSVSNRPQARYLENVRGSPSFYLVNFNLSVQLAEFSS
jgi:hypothetical protein